LNDPSPSRQQQRQQHRLLLHRSQQELPRVLQQGSALLLLLPAVLQHVFQQWHEVVKFARHGAEVGETSYRHRSPKSVASRAELQQDLLHHMQQHPLMAPPLLVLVQHVILQRRLLGVVVGIDWIRPAPQCCRGPTPPGVAGATIERA
jgi:hypothetical protein